MPTADLEIGLHRWDEGRYAIELRYRRPDDDADLVPTRALVVVANPADVETDRPLQPVDVEGELTRVKEALRRRRLERHPARPQGDPS